MPSSAGSACASSYQNQSRKQKAESRKAQESAFAERCLTLPTHCAALFVGLRACCLCPCGGHKCSVERPLRWQWQGGHNPSAEACAVWPPSPAGEGPTAPAPAPAPAPAAWPGHCPAGTSACQTAQNAPCLSHPARAAPWLHPVASQRMHPDCRAFSPLPSGNGMALDLDTVSRFSLAGTRPAGRAAIADATSMETVPSTALPCRP